MKNNHPRFLALAGLTLLLGAAVFWLSASENKTSQPTREELAQAVVDTENPKQHHSPDVVQSEVTQEEKTSSLAKLIHTASSAAGKAMYVWGGGWNEADTGAGVDAVTLGIPETWQQFMDDQSYGYDYLYHQYQIHDGLDCSGYLGWALYNTVESENNLEGYVVNARNYGSYLSGRGWGSVKSPEEITEYQAGDIMFNEGHVFLVLGQYEDGSLLILHSTPPGVQFSGTPATDGTWNSIAKEEASLIMSERAPEFTQTFGLADLDMSYLTEYSQFRWNDTLFPDAAAVQDMDVQEIVNMIYAG